MDIPEETFPPTLADIEENADDTESRVPLTHNYENMC